ncbi:hypothetical protein ANN_09397 [Periplaneta americana]|uniref:Uncharacterized protein n=1 Tax=Periplaneta americana TaxID=6978 RepID=A0ABQ8TN95_PERAM|nr:hypothetical protein ANN_09397 [Periplaneta americana]
MQRNVADLRERGISAVDTIDSHDAMLMRVWQELVRFSLNRLIGDKLQITGQATNFLENTIPHVLEDTPLINGQTFTSCMMALLHTSVIRMTWITDRWIGRGGPFVASTLT